MKYLKLFENIDPKDSKRITQILIKLASLVSEEISGSNVHICEKFDVFELYKLSFGEDKLMKVINVVLDEFINRCHDENVHKYDKSDFYIDTDSMETFDSYKDIENRTCLSFYDIYNLLIDRKNLASDFLTFDDVKKYYRIYCCM